MSTCQCGYCDPGDVDIEFLQDMRDEKEPS